MKASYCSASLGRQGRGPTNDMCLGSTLASWGSSSSEVRRSSAPNRVTRGSCFILNSTPAPSFRASSAALRASAFSYIVRNLIMVNGTPSRPTRVWVKKARPGEPRRTARATSSSTGASTRRASRAAARSATDLIARRGPVSSG